MPTYTIALDAMGGDDGPRIVVPAAIQALKLYDDLKLILVGDEHKLRRYLKSQRHQETERLVIHHASQIVTMDELPSHALRNKKDSSMRVALNLIKSGVAQACVSAGNTGALMATARFVLKTLPGIDRPAIITQFPTFTGSKGRVLDLGANVDSNAETLFQFGVMGSVLVTALEGIANPSVGLLNIGVEEIKGNDQVKRTAQLFTECDFINYIGFVEGDDICKGEVDVIVCDGFVGNIALKASEGIAKLFVAEIKAAFQRNWYSKLAGLVSIPVFKHIKKKIDPAGYNGASLLGLNGIVIKSHGSTTVNGFANAIHEAMREVQNNVMQSLHDRVTELHLKGYLA